MFDELPLFRTTDPVTSRQGAAHIRLKVGSQLAQLLEVYAHPSAADGLTDDEAGNLTQIVGYWKRCSDLRTRGFIEPTGATRNGRAGTPQRVCKISDHGLNEYGKLRMDNARNA